ncbi:MAG: dienelactone hydrolase family protein [Deltaproteobacteria bacterium]|nr:dienelactone hydrolase family protein [Deltaproteobacteria bacterium]
MNTKLATLLLAFVCLAGCAGATTNLSIPTTGLSGAPEQIPLRLLQPDGPGPFPAVVILHDCSGLGPRSSRSPDRWAQELVRQGYAVAIPDSFTTRGHAGGVCTETSPRRAEVNPFRRVLDAYAALAYLRTLPDVDGSRVGLMGGSHGGSTTLASMAAPESESELLAPAKDAGFAAAVALYPGCDGGYGSWRAVRPSGRGGPVTGYIGVYKPVAPLLILIGADDDWTPAEPCRILAETSARSGYPVETKIYPGAHHAFDSSNPVRYLANRVNANAPGGRGATTGGDPAAWADSIREVEAFFGRHLKRAGGGS